MHSGTQAARRFPVVRGVKKKHLALCQAEGCTERANRDGKRCDFHYQQDYYSSPEVKARYRGMGRARSRKVEAERQRRLEEEKISLTGMTNRYFSISFCGKETTAIARYCDVRFPADLPLLADIEEAPAGSAPGPTPWEWAEDLLPPIPKKLTWEALSRAFLADQLSPSWPFTHKLYESLGAGLRRGEKISIDLFRRVGSLAALRSLESGVSVVFVTGQNGSVEVRPGRYLKISKDRLEPYNWDGLTIQPNDEDLRTGKLRIDRIKKPPKKNESRN